MADAYVSFLTVLFGSSTAHKDIRKELIENQRLEAIISMPSGVFKPYAGVSTGILILRRLIMAEPITYGFMICRQMD